MKQCLTFLAAIVSLPAFSEQPLLEFNDFEERSEEEFEIDEESNWHEKFSYNDLEEEQLSSSLISDLPNQDSSGDDHSTTSKFSNKKLREKNYYIGCNVAYTHYFFELDLLALKKFDLPGFKRGKHVGDGVPSLDLFIGKNFGTSSIPLRVDFHYTHVFEGENKVKDYFIDTLDPQVFNNAIIEFYSDQFMVDLYYDFFKSRWINLYAGMGGGVGINSLTMKLMTTGIDSFSLTDLVYFTRNVNAIWNAEMGIISRIIECLAINVFGRYTSLGLVESESRPQLSSSVGDKGAWQYSVGGGLIFTF